MAFSLQAPIKNYGLIFGWDFGSNDLLINISLSAVFCLFLFYYILSLVFIPKNFYHLQTGISVLFSGFTGNVINKIANGYIIDFISWSPSQSLNMYFNTADVFQTLGWLLILMQFVFLRKYLWREGERRKQLFVMRIYQLKFVGYCVLAFFCLSFFFLLLNYQFIGFVEDMDFYTLKQAGSFFFQYSFFILFLFWTFILIFFIYLSNKIYGPLYAFEKYIKALIKGENPKDLQMRKNDQLKHLEDLAKEIKESLNKSN